MAFDPTDFAAIRAAAQQLAGPAPAAPVLVAPAPTNRAGRPEVVGLARRGNIDLSRRPIVHNPDGSISTVRSISIGLDNGQTALIPTVVGNRVVSNDAAIAHYLATGQHLGIFNDENLANRYAENLHAAQAAEYLPPAVAAARRLSAPGGSGARSLR